VGTIVGLALVVILVAFILRRYRRSRRRDLFNDLKNKKPVCRYNGSTCGSGSSVGVGVGTNSSCSRSREAGHHPPVHRHPVPPQRRNQRLKSVEQVAERQLHEEEKSKGRAHSKPIQNFLV